MAKRFFFLFVFSLTFLSITMFGQKTCGTVTYREELEKKSSKYSKDEFEHWMSAKLRELRSVGGRTNIFNQPNQTITIPVVIHIIHNGEPVGTGSNIHDTRIMEQLDRLNKDFRRLNADTVNTSPEFMGVAADTEIEFVLAKRDPHGLPTTGINRVQGPRPVYGLVHNTELKSLSYWPAEDYMNLWVAELENLLGYAQFPVSSLEGLEIASENRLTDGVVIDTDFFGINASISPESIGRTCTHEVGHFLGLRHTWGDGGCSVDDFCEDTPRSNNSNFGCPDAESCGSTDMVENYMDLTDDLCMNLFTECQKSRMQVVMSNSPRRASLVQSKGGLEPVMADNDAGIREIIAPTNNNCNPNVSPEVEIQNTGTNTITSFTIELRINGTPVETKLVNQELALLETTTVNFEPVTVTNMNTIELEILETNETQDGNSENNSKQVDIESQSFGSMPILETFESIPVGWQIVNDDNSITWEIANAPSEDPGNTAARMNFFSYVNANGEFDYLVTTALDLSTYTGLSLEFDVAYAPFSGGDEDGLIVAISEDCGNTFLSQNHVFRKQGTELATAGFMAGSFVPSGRNDWRTETINLDQFAGNPNLQIAFIAINDYGNNMYLDNVHITGTRIPDIDLGIAAILRPASIFCQTDFAPTVQVTNTGLNPVSNFQLSYQLESGQTGSVEYSGPSFSAGQQVEVSFDPITVADGLNNITVLLDQIEGHGEDGMESNNSLQQPFIIDDSNDLIPLIEPFDQPLETNQWNVLNTDGEITWELATTGGNESSTNQAAYLNFFGYNRSGETDFLVTPVLDFSNSTNPLMIFDLAYAGSPNFNDGLLVLASTDCGLNYSDTLFQAFGSELSTTTSGVEFFPDDTSDWKLTELDLSAYAGNPEVRIAFVGINDFGNNLFIDNVQFFISDRTTSLTLEANQMIAYPNPNTGDFNVTFNLSERSDVDLRIIDYMGRTVWNRMLPDILNQTLGVELPNSSGVYILQATGGGFTDTRRIIVL